MTEDLRDRAPGSTDSVLARAALVTIGVTVTGSALGLVRDLLLARLFGADGGTDAFLVAWTVPETAFTLVVEGAMALLMIPLFSRALSAAPERDAARAARAVVAATAGRILAVLAAATVAVLLGAPLLVRVLAPGLADPGLAVTCTRWTALTVLTFGLAGYLSAALRARGVFAAPAGVHLAYNTGIIAVMLALHTRWGVVSAAAGVALGGLLMALVQVPGFLRHVGLPRRRARAAVTAVALGAVGPIVVYTLARQAQVFVERFLGSDLPPGTISHLNYAQKVGQLPMVVALLVCTATFPALARTVAAGEAAAARRRLETDLRTVMAMILVAAAYLVAFAPTVVQVLLEHGRFTAEDTAATAGVLRVYALGLLGHGLVGALVRPYFSDGGRTWYPAVAMGAGLAVTTGLAAAGVGVLHAHAIAAANGVGITVTALLLLVGLRDRVVAVPVRVVCTAAGRLAAAATVAGAFGWAAGRAAAGLPPLLVAALGGVVVLAVFAGVARLAGFPEVTEPASAVIRRLRRGR